MVEVLVVEVVWKWRVRAVVFKMGIVVLMIEMRASFTFTFFVMVAVKRVGLHRRHYIADCTLDLAQRPRVHLFNYGRLTSSPPW
jgi:hypothetical protein